MDAITASALPPQLADLPDPTDSAAVLAHLRGGDLPRHHGPETTFVYVGPATSVALKHWMDDFPRLPAFTRITGTDLWYLTARLPEGARIDYKLDVRDGGRRRLLLDPLNDDHSHDPFGTNSVVAGPGYVRPDWTKPDPTVPAGRAVDLKVPPGAFPRARPVRVLLPAGYDAGRTYPLLIVHDGSEYLQYSALGTVLDNLTHRGEIVPIVAALVDPGERNREYTGDERHGSFLADGVLPVVDRHVAISADPRQRALMGASLGAVAALHATRQHPNTWEKLILHSGSFVTALGGRYRRGRVFAPVVAFMGRFLADPGRLPAAAYLSVGRYDGLAADNRRMAEVLPDLGVDVTYEEVRDGHTWENWRDRLRAGLATMFPGPGGPGASVGS